MTLGWKLGIEDIYDEQKYNETATERVLAFSKDFNVNSSSISTVCTSHCKSYPQHCGLPSDYASTALAIVYVLDASTITKNIRDVTEFLFQILSDPTIHGNRTSVLIVCNKQDMTLAKGSSGNLIS